MRYICFKNYKILIIYLLIFLITFSTFFFILYKFIFHSIDNVNESSVNEICSEKDKENEKDENTKRKEFLKEKYKEKKLIALTFDDGPGNYTTYLVDELKKRNVNATFFILGECASTRQSTVKYIVENGNEIGIHSYVHKLFTRISNEEIETQIDKTRNVLYTATDSKIFLIRVPYGSINDRVNEILEKNQLTNVLWDVDSKDWKFRNTNKTYKYTLKRITGNDIILMHDIYKTSVEAALKLVDTLQSECYTFVTVSQLLELREDN